MRLTKKVANWRPWRTPLRDIARDMVRRADAARDAGQFRDAAFLYGEASRLVPGKPGVHVQCGNMLKDLGDHAAAEQHYRIALQLRPSDADAFQQLGHLYKSWGRLDQARLAYGRAAELRPDWDAPRKELANIDRSGWAGDAPPPASPQLVPTLIDAGNAVAAARDIDRLAPELFPSHPDALLHGHGEELALRAWGRQERSHWGIVNTVRGVEAIRGFCISATPVVEVQMYLNDQLIYRGSTQAGASLAYERDNSDLRKYTFNIWFDFSQFSYGRHRFELRAIDMRGRSQHRHETLVIAAPLWEADFPSSDQLVNIDPDLPIDEQINARPSMVRPGIRSLLSSSPKVILVQRLDQLGDMVVSVPALRVLRAMFPDARLIGLLSPANAELGATLSLFDDIIVADFPDDRWQRRRIMPLEDQIALRTKLEPLDIDMAIDLSENSPSRLLLALSGAPFRFGFRHHLVPNLPLDVEGNSHDRMNGHEVVPHTNKLIGMMEWLRAMMRSEPNVTRRDDLDRGSLGPFGINLGDKFVVLHDGARLAFSRWPHYAELARRLLANTSLKVVMLTDDPAMRAVLPAALTLSNRFHLVDGRLEFDQFDALVSFCDVFVGNDSGPKHLASLRGAKVVSLHMARNNWNEWGQENGGYILSRKLPCAGCQISHDPEECGRDFICIRGIKPEEVMAAVQRLL
ncbi:glycosyltransferase family 9 protein [Sphingomonas sp. ASY06-1R]|uniref:glycosyltransferase family 9 protein n=1 Tax=Sphingomonas sp. ASY06-1R TaxID=3445771 RepID=UPI003FA27DFF